MTLSVGVLLPLSGPQSAPSASQWPADLGHTWGQGAESRRASLSFSFTPTKFCGECFWCRWKSQIRALLSALGPLLSLPMPRVLCPDQALSCSQTSPHGSASSCPPHPGNFSSNVLSPPLPPALEASLSLQGCLRLPAMSEASLPLGAPQ